ncbi:hypothetical protein DLAC_01419 [Tieghemostelium lacteum]|uniref:THH1/TOM1/TOM3 domain-containing protein n=1 Tax=Tieghemostelium lacteum TaxID=361077 RepID=A0A152A5D0_TIELA|nr:hypothetical protein DLAC_01419 [Tieghemostelium lacteum]|eukprot:KYR01438.1 hypothetical protein DLAC_01419 [Tieghemostelium lacteum]
MNYTIKTITLVGTQITVASASVYFNQPLYILESKACPSFECPAYNYTCPPCDFTHGNPLGCGNRPSGCPPCQFDDDEFYVHQPCNPQYWKWEDIQLNTPLRRTIPGNTVTSNFLQFRYYPTPDCIGYRISAKYYKGTCSLSADFRNFHPVAKGGAKAILSEQIDPNMILCPSSYMLTVVDYQDVYYKSYPYDTLFIAVKNDGVIDMEFEILLEPIPVEEPPVTPVTCQEAHPDFQCVNDNELVYNLTEYAINTFLKFSFTIDQCSNITWITSFLQNDIDLYISETPDVSPTNFDWSSTYSFDELITIQGCPDAGSTSKTYYFGIYMFYTSNYQFWVTTKAINTLRDISTPPILSGQYALFDTSYIRNEQLNKTERCDNYDRNCLIYFPLYPRVSVNSLWPTPGIYYVEGFQSPRFLNTYVTTEETPAQNVYQFGIILSLLVDSVRYNYINPEDLPGFKVHFLNRLFTASAKPISGEIPLVNSVQSECSYDSFLEVEKELNHIIEGLDQVDYTLINGKRYSLDLLTYDDRYYACKAMAESFLELDTSHELSNTTMCFETENLTIYYSDPCCSRFASFDKCCRSRVIDAPVTTLLSINEDAVDENCAFPSCTISVLNDFAQSIIGSQLDPCRVTSEDENYLKQNMYDTFRDCKETLIVDTPCQNDQQCQLYYNDTGAFCNHRSGLCYAPRAAAEKLYILCILDNIYPSLKHEVFTKYQIPVTSANLEIIDQFHQIYLENDCFTPYNIDSNIRKIFHYHFDASILQFCFPMVSGLDKSTPSEVYDSCYQGVYTAVWVDDQYSQGVCLQFIRCGWMGETGNTGHYNEADLIDACLEIPTAQATAGHYCGDCSDPFLSCFSDLTLTTEETCTEKFACYNPIADDYTYSYQLPTASTVEECTEQYGSCNTTCGYSCGGYGCRLSNASPTGSCPDVLGYQGYLTVDPANNQDYCTYYYMESSQCASVSGQYLDCSSFDVETCTICNRSPELGCGNFGLLCFQQPLPCTNKQDCENSGKCSDEIYFSKQFLNYPAYQPKCVFPRDYDISYNATQPSCKLEMSQDSPFGCFLFTNVSLVEQSACEAAGGFWWTQAVTQAECNAYEPVCLGFEQSEAAYFLPFTKRFNNKTEDDCACANQQWVKPFEWSPGVWQPANAVPLKWIPINATQPYDHITEYGNALYFEKLFNEFNVANFKRTTLLYKSEILCRISSVKNSLQSLSCSCSTDGSSECFDTLNPPIISVIKPCYAPPQSFPVLPHNNTLSFPLGSIDTGACVSISVGEISLNSFLSKKILALSSNFVSYQVAPDYSIYNSDRAIIGRVLEDGVILEFFTNGTNSFEICLSNQLELDPKNYPHLDFAFVIDENAGHVEPLNCLVTHETAPNIYCCTVSKIEPISKYLLIERIENWQAEVYKPFSPSSTRMLYTLAVFYLILSIYGLGNLGFFLYLKFFATESLKFVHLLFLFLTMFCFIRMIYFFILPQGNIIDQSANVGEYILVVLPTFLYFTSFTIVVVIWYTLTTNSFSSNLFKRMYRLIFLINLVLYILFIVIVLVFNFTKEKTPPTCGGRILAEYTNTSPQKVVSILYAVLQSVLSLAIGLAFMYYGKKIYNRLSEIKTRSDASDIQKKKVLYIGVICSSGFILHCVFIIILVSANPSNVIFSFIGLVVTEIIPVVTLFFFNNQFPWNKVTENAKKKLSNLSNSSTRSSDSNSIQLSSNMDTSMSSSTTRPSSSKASASPPSAYSKEPIVYLNNNNR